MAKGRFWPLIFTIGVNMRAMTQPIRMTAKGGTISFFGPSFSNNVVPFQEHGICLFLARANILDMVTN